MSLSSVHNYYERLVFDHINEYYADRVDSEELADLACLALNKMPSRYIRHDIDMSFYLSTTDHIEIETMVSKACKEGFERLKEVQQRYQNHPEELEKHNHG